MNKKITTRLLAILLTIIFIFSMAGCGKTAISNDSSGETTTENSTSKNKETETKEQETTTSDKNSSDTKEEQKKFNDFTNEIFTSELALNILNFHCTLAHPENFGIKDYEISLGSFSAQEDSESYELLDKYIDELADFNYNLLTSEQQLTYDIFKTYANDSKKYKGYRLHNDYMSPLNGMQSYIPTILAEYVFYDEQDVKDYLEILKTFPSFFEDLISFEKEQSEAGFFMPDFEVDKIVDQCQQFIANPDNHYLIDSFNSRIDSADFLDNNAKELYKSSNITQIKESVIPAYEYIISELPKLKGTCKNEGGLANFKNGKEFYELLVRDYTGSDKSVPEIKKMIEDKYKADFNEILGITLKDNTIFDKMSECPVDLSDPTKVLNDLKSKIAVDFPTGLETTFTVSYVPESMEKYTSPAYYILPPIDNLNNNSIYINKSQVSESIEDFVTLAHEGFPGHLFQTTYFYSQNPSNIRKLFSFSGYSEGWGTYAEMYSYSLAGTEDAVTRINELNKTYTFAIYCLTDIGINYEGWTYDETMKFLSGIGLGKEDSNTIYETLIEEPALYLAYYVGYLEFMELRSTAEEALGDNFSLKAFHTFLLKTGPAQFEIIRDRMDTWIDEQKNSKELRNNRAD